jgi:dGTPase
VTDAGIASLEQVRCANRRMVELSPAMEQRRREAKEYLFRQLYHAEDLDQSHALADETIDGLFQYWMKHPEQLPANQQAQIATEGAPRVVADYIAGMTDNFISEQWRLVRE